MQTRRKSSGRDLANQGFSRVLLRWLVGWLLLMPGLAPAEQLPIKTYTTADGLAQDSVNRIVRDSRGFLWFCTGEGLSRFDGYQFTSYTAEQGLPHRWVSDLLETRNGNYWVATGDGVCRFNPDGSPLFRTFYPAEHPVSHRVQVLVEDLAGRIWCGTHAGVYLLDDSNGEARFQFVEMGMPVEGVNRLVQAMAADRQGGLWVGTRTGGLYRRLPDGRVQRYTTNQGLPDNGVTSLLEDRSGRMWVGTPRGLCRLVADPDPARPVVDRLFTARDGLVTAWIDALFERANGTMWVGNSGLSELIVPPESGGATGSAQQFRTYTTLNGLSSHYIGALAEDRDGNLWVGTESGGAMKLVNSGFTSYTEADGLAAPGVDSVFEDKSGELCVVSSGTKHFMNRFNGRRFLFLWPDFPKHISYFGWGYNQVNFQDHLGEWWIPTGQGLCHFPAVTRVEELAHTRPKALYTIRQGLPSDDIFRLYEDSHGDIWISTSSRMLTRWSRSTGTLHNFTAADGFVPLFPGVPAAFAEDAAGSLWIGHWDGGLTRYREGQFTFYTVSDGLPGGTVRSLYLDHARGLWIAASQGGARLDDPAADHPIFSPYGTAEGLSSSDIYCFTEDRSGRIYIGTGRGVDRLDPQTGHVRHYTAADGLMKGKVTSAYRDPHGVLWFASNVHGLSRLVPAPDPPETQPPILITGLRISGEAHTLSQLGESGLTLRDLRPGQNQLNIDFVGLDFGSGEILRYQYMLEGADKDWSPPGQQRSVNYANLAPGRYRFLARAVNAEGLTSAMPAALSFTIKPPIWRRWWFLTLAGLLLTSAVYLAYRARVTRLLELERIRTRIATDLHDDIGANLSLIAMLSEVARGRIRPDDSLTREWFSTIATTSRDTVDAMSDIVWSVNPMRDHLSDLTQRMRRFAEDVFAARDVELTFREAESSRDLKVGADVRREVFLIFKESINNMIRHSGCTAACVELEIGRGWLVLQMSDNGRGIEPARAGSGNGLASMRVRATRLGGRLEVSSLNGSGTMVTLKAPLGTRAGYRVP